MSSDFLILLYSASADAELFETSFSCVADYIDDWNRNAAFVFTHDASILPALPAESADLYLHKRSFGSTQAHPD